LKREGDKEDNDCLGVADNEKKGKGEEDMEGEDDLLVEIGCAEEEVKEVPLK
jgi:hypothetical protein